MVNCDWSPSIVGSTRPPADSAEVATDEDEESGAVVALVAADELDWLVLVAALVDVLLDGAARRTAGAVGPAAGAQPDAGNRYECDC